MFSNDELPGDEFALKARLVVPVESPLIEDGVISIEAGRIVAVGENMSGQPPINLGNVAILPGLINAHTHLEFSNLDQPLGRPGMRFPDWIRAVMTDRRQVDGKQADSVRWHAATRKGIRESLDAGVTTVADIIRPEFIGGSTLAPSTDFRETPIGYLAFREVIGLAHHRTDSLVDSARRWVEQSRDVSEWQPAISPHAPYTVHPELLGELSQLSAAAGFPLAMHLAESPEELELLASHSGEFLALLKDLDAWDPTAIPKGTRPLDYLRALSRASRALVIHGNYLSQEEIDFAAAHSNKLAVIYCPRTHAYFEHDDYPLSSMLAAGVNVALGTDSRASNPDLDLLEEMRHVACHHAVSGETVLRMGTINAATALGLQPEIGSLARDKLANLTCIALPRREISQGIDELLFDSTESVVATMIAGRWMQMDS
ncbi:MAG: amidohydrolase family protein [Planctomycetes bacterium]|nr:amidohydrolase family protein [Planctomycetota bacterium]